MVAARWWTRTGIPDRARIRKDVEYDLASRSTAGRYEVVSGPGTLLVDGDETARTSSSACAQTPYTAVLIDDHTLMPAGWI
jgi:hypothetical protein